MQELNMQEVEQISGGFPPIIIGYILMWCIIYPAN